MKKRGQCKIPPKNINILALETPEKFTGQPSIKTINKKKSKAELFDISKIYGIDCEMVGVGEEDGVRDVLAKVSVVTRDDVLLDTFVRADEVVTEYRTEVSGVTKEDLEGPQARDFKSVVSEVEKILSNAEIIVGHGLSHDEEVLQIEFPSWKVRDTSKYRPFSEGGRTPALKRLALKHLGKTIQKGQHNPVEDARAALLLYLKVP